MKSLAEQIQIVQQFKAATNLSDSAAYHLIDEAMENFLGGGRNGRQVRFDLEKIVRRAYRASARAAQDAARQQAGKGKRWAPVPPGLVTETLERLLKDVRRNLQEFKDSEQEEKDYRKAVLRFRLSATVAAQKGFSDGQYLSFRALLEDGVQSRKYWLANFVDNEPCTDCANLHGMEVEAMSEFPRPGNYPIYVDLYGPPLHPQCRCTALYVVVDDTNDQEFPDLGAAAQPKMMKSETIKNMPLAIFRAIIGAVTRALDLLRKAAGL